MSNKKRTIAIIFIMSIAFFSFLLFRYLKKPVTAVDITSNIKVTFSGVNGSGKCADISNDIQIDNVKNIADFIDSISYEVDPETELSNGDIITFTVKYSKRLARAERIEIVNGDTRTFTVEGLKEDKGIGDYTTIDNIDVPNSVDFSEQEKEDYMSYIQSGQTMADTNDDAAAEIKTGTGSIETFLTDQSFKEYDDALTYANISNQKYIINARYVPEHDIYLYDVKFTDDASKKWYKGKAKSKAVLQNEFFPLVMYDGSVEETFITAMQYGESSSLDFRIEPSMEYYKLYGWNVVFKAEKKQE